jgi:hypothetical protein
MPIPNTNRYEDVLGTGLTVITTRLDDAFIIDTADRQIANAHCWSRHENGYARAVARVDGRMKTIYLHRLICQTSPDAPHVDHIDGDPANCSRLNLRACTRNQNLRNQKRRVDNTSGHKGVGFHGLTKKFRARVRIGGVAKHLGLFATAETAAVAAMSARDAAHGEFARHV